MHQRQAHMLHTRFLVLVVVSMLPNVDIKPGPPVWHPSSRQVDWSAYTVDRSICWLEGCWVYILDWSM